MPANDELTCSENQGVAPKTLCFPSQEEEMSITTGTSLQLRSSPFHKAPCSGERMNAVSAKSQRLRGEGRVCDTLRGFS